MRIIIRKSIVFVVLLFVLFLVSCGENTNKQNEEKKETESVDIFTEALKKIDIPNELYEDIELPSIVTIEGKNIEIRYQIDEEALTSDGKVHPFSDEDMEVNIECIMTCDGEERKITLEKKTVVSMEKVCNKIKDDLVIPSVIDSDVEFPQQIGNVKLKWNTSNITVLSKEGKCSFVSENKDIKITCQILYKTEDDSFKIETEYDVVVKPWSALKRYESVIDGIEIPAETASDINLPQELDYGVKCDWEASDATVINKIGNVTRSDNDKLITLKLTLSCDDSSETQEYTYDVKVLKAITVEGEMNFYRHILVNRARDLESANMTGLVYDETAGRIVLENNSLTGVYESNIYNTLDFYRIVGSFSCITSEKATCELEYSIKVDGKWSKYLSYGQFGLGRTNVYYNQSDTNAMIDTDMVIPLNNKVGKAFKYRITLRRENLSVKSPALSLIASTLFMNDYNYAVYTGDLPDSVDWDVPKLNQNIVPKIGNVICSATTTTMLLKFAGYDFSDKGYTYEHEYMAKMVADTGHNNPTYGNWSYNMMAAGGFGANAYVGKYYSWDEIRSHLANYGPLGVSISGNFGRYTTGGHLIVLRGYRIINGETTVICNDPNITEVYYEVPLETFLRCWGSVVYILEYNNKEVINFKYFK